jgi:hypothetical protein
MGSLVHLAGWLVLAFFLERTLMVVARDNYATPFNGAGSIAGVINRNTQAPMVYRVLVPWAAYGLRQLGMPLLSAYELVKIVLTGFALWAVQISWGHGVAFLTAAILPVTFLFDYWDWAAELLGLCLCLSGDFFLALLGVFAWGLSRETVLIGGPAYFLVTGDWLGAVGVLAAGVVMLSAVHLIQGKHERYCKLFWLSDNLKMIRSIREWERPAWMSSIVVSLALVVIALIAAPFTGAKGLLAPALIGFSLVFGKINETRIFTSIVPWVAYALIRLFLSF